MGIGFRPLNVQAKIHPAVGLIRLFAVRGEIRFYYTVST